ncbi:P1 protein [Plantago asiatica virus A]|uniref:P1 protein n=1 Tax=Plantago asiatica virus A TaxID=2871160 RepID=A0AAE7YBC3_9VIRU|nr:P1 protein [Plantago asiatica virus A]
MALITVFLVVYLLFSPSLSAGFTLPATGTDFRVRTFNHSMHFATLPDIDTRLEPIVKPELRELTSATNHTPTYADILHLFSAKVSDDIKKISVETFTTLKNFLESGWAATMRLSQRAFESFLWIVIILWSSFLWQITLSIWYLVQTYTAAVVSLLLLYFLSLSLVRAVRWIFGGCPLYLLTGIFKTLRMISRAVWCKQHYNREKACEGYTTYTIPQNPPKNAVLMAEYPDNSHAGYATCIRLFNNENALVTAYHVWEQIRENGKIVSTRTGTKIPANLFQEVVGNPTADLVILRGPPNWEGTLAVKSVQTVNAQQLAKSKTTIYHFNGQNWMASNSEIVGHDKVFATMLSQTEAGYSGSPYFNGKSLVGVHVGGAKHANHNLMAPIPSIPGLTSPNYVFETTAPTGRVFVDSEIDEIGKLYKEAERILNFKSKTGRNWADELDEETTRFYECESGIEFTWDDQDLGQKAYESLAREFPDADWRLQVIKSFVSKYRYECGEVYSYSEEAKFMQAVFDLEREIPLGYRDKRIRALRKIITNSDDRCIAQLQEAIPDLSMIMESGNDKGSTDCQTTGEILHTPSKEPENGPNMLKEIVQAMAEKVNISSIEKEVIRQLSEKAMRKPKTVRKRGGKKPTTSSATSKPNIAGKYQPPHKRSPGLKPAEPCPISTTQSKNKARSGAKPSSANTQTWRPKPKDSAGPSSAPRLN